MAGSKEGLGCNGEGLWLALSKDSVTAIGSSVVVTEMGHCGGHCYGALFCHCSILCRSTICKTMQYLGILSLVFLYPFVNHKTKRQQERIRGQQARHNACLSTFKNKLKILLPFWFQFAISGQNHMIFAFFCIVN